MGVDVDEDGEAGIRPGEIAFAGPTPETDAFVHFIGHVRSPWTTRADCPKNLRQARERWAGRDGPMGHIRIDPRYRPALAGLFAPSWILVFTWLHEARRDLAVQRPRHRKTSSGTFSLRSPVRPNPIGFHLVRLLSIDPGAGVLAIDSIDVLDGTPLVDLKPYIETIDRNDD